jgi:hypothetical protein
MWLKAVVISLEALKVSNGYKRCRCALYGSGLVGAGFAKVFILSYALAQ